MVKIYEFLTFVLINEGDSSRKLPNMFASKNLRMTKKASRADLIKKKAWRGVLKIDARTR